MYQPPTPEELKNLIHVQFELSRSQAGKLADIDKSVIGKWSVGKGQMPYSVLFTIVARTTGKRVNPENWREDINNQ